MATSPETEVRRERPVRPRWLLLAVLLAGLGLAIAGLAVQQYRFWLAPVEPGSTAIRQVIIPPGAGAAEVGRILYAAGLIKTPHLWDFYIRGQDLDKQLQAGTYQLSPGLSVPEIVEELLEGQAAGVQFTIPEGYTIQQIAQAVEDSGLATRAAFMAAAGEDGFQFPWLDQLPVGSNRLEGFLFPDTYRLRAGAPPREIIQKMLDRFVQVFTPEYQERAASLNLTVLEAVTLASIVEKEAKLAEERPIIAGVFHNRLRQGWRLESCATVQYILGEPKPVLSYADLRLPSPYNTYLQPGLPPGPIASPGRAALEAALFPADVPYFYFVANGDGSHTFSRTFQEHNQAKAAASAK